MIERGLNTFVEVGTALLTIRDKRLYRDGFETFATFEEYCEKRWGLKKSHAYEIMEASKVVTNLKSSAIAELPTNEAQARPLTALKEPEQQQKVWNAAVEDTFRKICDTMPLLVIRASTPRPNPRRSNVGSTAKVRQKYSKTLRCTRPVPTRARRIAYESVAGTVIIGWNIYGYEMRCRMSDLEVLKKNLEDFEKRYPKFNKCVPGLQQAFWVAFKIPSLGPQDRQDANLLIYFLAKLCMDRFQDITLMCSQNRGDGCASLVRTMFEGLVNAKYIQKHPEKSIEFKRYVAFYLQKMWGLKEELQGIPPDPEGIRKLEELKKHFPGTDWSDRRLKSDWTTRDLTARARSVGLGEYLILAYYRQNEYTHPSMLHVSALSKIEDGKMVPFSRGKETNRLRVKEALAISHKLAVDLLELLHDTFDHKELEPWIIKCEEERLATWTGKTPKECDEGETHD